MKRIMAVWLLSLLGSSGVFAQEMSPIAQPGEPVRIPDSEAVIIIKSIEGYVQGSFGRGYIETFDRKKGEKVTLRLDRIVTDDPNRIVFTAPDRVAVCGECTQVILEGKDKVKEAGDKYEVWFLMQRGDMLNSRVLDVIVKSVNGNPMYKWSQDEAGTWTAVLVPDPE